VITRIQDGQYLFLDDETRGISLGVLLTGASMMKSDGMRRPVSDGML
jgi:hypothetical protein